MFTKRFLIATTGLAILIGATPAMAQQFSEPFSFRVHNNVAAMNMAVILRNVQNEGSSSSTTSSGSSGSSSGSGAIYNIYTSNTIGNMTEIQTILEQGATGWIDVDSDITQDGSGSSQSASSEGTQVFGGANNLGDDGTATNNVTTEGTTETTTTP